MNRNCSKNACVNCTCDKAYRARKANEFPANAPFAPVQRPEKIVRRKPREAILSLQKKYRESMNILA